jgi:hypothetical protein
MLAAVEQRVPRLLGGYSKLPLPDQMSALQPNHHLAHVLRPYFSNRMLHRTLPVGEPTRGSLGNITQPCRNGATSWWHKKSTRLTTPCSTCCHCLLLRLPQAGQANIPGGIKHYKFLESNNGQGLGSWSLISSEAQPRFYDVNENEIGKLAQAVLPCYLACTVRATPL